MVVIGSNGFQPVRAFERNGFSSHIRNDALLRASSVVDLKRRVMVSCSVPGREWDDNRIQKLALERKWTPESIEQVQEGKGRGLPSLEFSPLWGPLNRSSD